MGELLEMVGALGQQAGIEVTRGLPRRVGAALGDEFRQAGTVRRWRASRPKQAWPARLPEPSGVGGR